MKAHIYTLVTREKWQQGNSRVVSVLGSGNSFGSLSGFYDVSLPVGNLDFDRSEHTTDFIVPMIGPIDVHAESSAELVATGEILTISQQAFSCVNTAYEWVNFLRISTIGLSVPFQKTAITDSRNRLQLAFESAAVKGYIGIYDGRRDEVFRLTRSGDGIFAFVINGAFEFANRLLETRDALSVLEATEVDFEALSGNAIMLLLEVAMG